MVNTINPEDSNTSLLIVEWIKKFFGTNPRSKTGLITKNQAKLLIGNLLLIGPYSTQIKSIERARGKEVEFEFKNECKNGFVAFRSYQNLKQFPAYSDFGASKIVFCMNNIKNEAELKLNFDRELSIMDSLTSSQVLDSSSSLSEPKNEGLSHPGEEGGKDKEFVRAAWKACRKSYEPYFDSSRSPQERSLMKEATRTCVKHYTKVISPFESHSFTNQNFVKILVVVFLIALF